VYTFGIIGGGMIAEFHAQAILAMGKGTKLGAIYARSPAKAKTLGEKFGCKSFSKLEEFLAEKEINIVTIATPSGAHLEPAIAAAKAKKHIICEKPLEVTPERINKMIVVAKKENVLLSGIFNRRFNPAVEQLKMAIEKKRYDSGKWRGTMELDGGGALMNQAIHTIDLLIYFVGKVKRVSASIALLTHEKIEVEDTAVAILEFENGALGTIQGSTSCWSSTGHPAEIQICGDKGSAFLSDASFRVWDFKEKEKQDIYVTNNLMQGNEKGLGANDPNAIDFLGHQRNFENVIASLEKNKAPLISGTEAMKSVELIDAIYRSAKQGGRWINL